MLYTWGRADRAGARCPAGTEPAPCPAALIACVHRHRLRQLCASEQACCNQRLGSAAQKSNSPQHPRACRRTHMQGT
eukprot:293221-Rhodomonas_salina.1